MPPSSWARPMVATVSTSRGSVGEPTDDPELDERADARSRPGPARATIDSAHGRSHDQEQLHGEQTRPAPAIAPLAKLMTRFARQIRMRPTAVRPVADPRMAPASTSPTGAPFGSSGAAITQTTSDGDEPMGIRAHGGGGHSGGRTRPCSMSRRDPSGRRRRVRSSRPVRAHAAVSPRPTWRVGVPLTDRESGGAVRDSRRRPAPGCRPRSRTRVVEDLAGVVGRRVVVRPEAPRAVRARSWSGSRTCPSRRTAASGSARHPGCRWRACRAGCR